MSEPTALEIDYRHQILELTNERDFLEEKLKEAVNQLGIERNERDKSIEMIHRSSQDINRLEQERDELAAQLKELQSHIRCIYCNEKYTAEQSGELADHILSCDKSPLVQMVKQMESRITDYMDLMNDELQRIVAITDDTEIVGICQRAMVVITQNEPVIKQRDDAVKECDTLKILLAEKNETANTFMNQVKKLHVERDQLAAKCAEMREALEFYNNPKHEGECVFSDKVDEGCYLCNIAEQNHQHKVVNALSDQCGVGWCSPDERKTLEMKCLIWSAIFQKYQSFLANGSHEIKTEDVIKDYLYCSQVGVPSGWLSPEKKKVLVEALERIRNYPVHSEPVGGAYEMQDIAGKALEACK